MVRLFLVLAARWRRWNRFSFLLCLPWVVGCRQELALPPPDVEDEEVGHVVGALGLVNHRTVEVERWTKSGSNILKQSSRVPAVGGAFLSRILTACALEVQLRSTPTSIPDASPCKTIRSPTIPDVWTGPVPAVNLASVATCAGHWALTIAEGTQPVYMGTYAPPEQNHSWIGLKPDRPPKVLLDALGIAESAVIPSQLNVDTVIKPPSPTDAPTWALLAADLFREASVISAQLLDPAQCPPADINRTITAKPSNEELNLMDVIASTLVDANQSMLEATEKAQQLVVAAAAFRRGTAIDPYAAALQEWRGRSDSRLEAVSTLVPVSEYAYQSRAAKPIWEMEGTDRARYYTTMPDIMPAAHNDVKYLPMRVMGWVQSPDMTPVGTTRTLTMYRRAAGTIITSAEPLAWGYLGAGTTILRIEGYSKPGPDLVVAPFVQYASNSAPDFPSRYRWFGPADPVVNPPTCTRTSLCWTPTQTFGGTAPSTTYMNVAPFEIPQTHAWQYPVVTLVPETQGAKRVEDILRSTGIDPRITNTRTVDTVSTDMLYAMQERYPGLYDTATAASLLDKLGITKADVERAAGYIVQVNQALGRAIIDDAANPGAPPGEENGRFKPGKPRLVFGTGWPSEKTHPAVIYARTGGRFEFPLEARPNYISVNGAGSTPGTLYARSSVLAALDYLRWLISNPVTGEFDATDYDARYTDSTRKMLKTVLAWSNPLSGPRVRVTMTKGAAPDRQVQQIDLLIGGLGYTSRDLARSELEFWLGEDGLECAMSGRVGGAKCARSRYVFPGSSWAIGAANDADVAKRGAVLVSLLRSQSPVSNVLSVDVPLFLVRTHGGQRSVVTAFYPSRPRDANTVASIWLTPFGDYTAEALAEGLAVDPGKPEKAYTSCAGIPTNVKVKLEDELTEAVEGQDDIESSFAHYLRRAREAATRADQLGDELVTQGLEMDRISEDARDALEDMCGGVINVGRLEAYACDSASGANCDVARLLQNPLAITDNTVRSDVEGLKRCLGIGNEPVTAVLGNAPACVWQASKTVGAAVQKFPPCVCPGNAEVCMNGDRVKECVRVPEENGECKPPRTGNGLTITWSKVQQLNIKASNAHPDPDDDGDEENRFSCGNLLSLRKHLEDHPSGNRSWTESQKWPSLDWIEHDELFKIATNTGFELDPYLFPTVTVGGKVLVQVGSKATGPASPAAGFPDRNADWNRWPCAPHEKLNGSLDGNDDDATALCAAGVDSLLCGGHCGSSSGSEQARAHEQASDLSGRLRNAVRVLKGITGASFTNYQRVHKEIVSRFGVENSLLSVGYLPDWHPFAPLKPANVSQDGSTMCWWRGYDASCQERKFGGPTTGMWLPEKGSWYGGFPPSAYFAWAEEPYHCESGDVYVDGRELFFSSENCGDMRELLRGKKSSVNMTYVGCAPVPDDLCIPIPDNNRTLGEKYCGDEAITEVAPSFLQQKATEAFSSEFLDFMRCKLDGASSRDVNELLEDTEYTDFAELVWDLNGQSEPSCPLVNPFMLKDEITKKVARELVRYDCRERNFNSLPAAGSDVPARVVLDALDLACVARADEQYGCETLLDENFPISDVADFRTMSQMVGCAADRVESDLERMLVVGVPQSVVDDIAARGPVQIYPSNRGEYGKTVALLAAELVAMRRHGDSVVQAVRDMQLGLSRSQVELEVLGFARNIKDIELYIEGLKAQKVDVEEEITNIRMNQVISSNLMECAATMSRAFGDWTRYAFGQGAGDHQAALITCANLTMQNQAEREIGDLNAQLSDLDRQIIDHAKRAIAEGQKITDQQKRLVLLDVAAKFNATMDKINEALIALQSSHALVQGYLADLDKQRNQATRLAAAVLMLNTDDVGRQYVINTAMRARMNTLLARYKRARNDAIRASFLARRGVEQKLGVDLSAMTTDMTGVPAPSQWADKLCSMSGIDYARIRSGKTASGEPRQVSPESLPNAYDYSDGYIGDYVTLLENFVDAYRIDYPFQDGDGLAVVSLRDEVLNVRRADSECPHIEGPNLLYYSDGKVRAADAERGWEFPCGTTAQLGTTLSSAAAPDLSPFSCGLDTSCADTSTVQAFTVTQAPSNSCLALPAGDTGELASADEALGYHLQASSCSPGATPFCQDLSGGEAAVTAVSGTLPTITDTAVEIARMPALRFTGAAGLKVDANLASTSTYSVVVSAGVTNLSSTSQNITLWSTSTTGAGTEGRTTLMLLATSSSVRARVFQMEWPVGNPTAFRVYTLDGTLPNVTGPWIIGMRANATTGRVELWLNGRPLAAGTSTVAVHPSNLDSTGVFAGPGASTAALLVSDLRAYTKWLSDAELAGVQNQLAGAHGVVGSVPSSLVASVPTMQQNVLLDRGSYLLSWYQYIGAGAVPTSAAGVRVSDGDVALTFVPAVNSDGTRIATTPLQEPQLLPGWVRYFGTIVVPQQGLITIGFTLPTGQTSMTMAAPQLEAVESLASFFPQPYFPTGSTLAAHRTSCEDSNGDKFRSSEYWKYGCEAFCPPGTGLDCGADGNLSNLPKACFYETTFGISLEEIEKGNLLQGAGFARGNFNYRFNNIAVNVVGTAVKNCELSANPSACYANNNLLYSLRQDEPFRIRNYDGNVVHAALYPGNIQQAQALLAERLITNPISSADRNLLTDYWRGELKGRPMDGNFRLRIYDTEGLDWQALEDIQLVLDYRYWTRER